MKNLIISQRAFIEIHSECFKYPDVETGGILIGICIGTDIMVPFAIGSGPGACRMPNRFAPDVKWQQKRLDQYFEKYGFNYIGSFHRHPGKLTQPSFIDYQAALQILTDPDWAVYEVVFPIIILENNSSVIYPYYIGRTYLKFEPMAIGVVPDDHPLLTSISKRRGRIHDPGRGKKEEKV